MNQDYLDTVDEALCVLNGHASNEPWVQANIANMTLLRGVLGALDDSGVEINGHTLGLDELRDLASNPQRQPSDALRESLRSYLFHLPGFQFEQPHQSDWTAEHHGYLVMQASRRPSARQMTVPLVPGRNQSISLSCWTLPSSP